MCSGTKSDVTVCRHLEQPLPADASCLIRHPETNFGTKDYESVDPPIEAYPWFEQKLQEKLKVKLHLDTRLMSNTNDTSTAFEVTTSVIRYTKQNENSVRWLKSDKKGFLVERAIMTHVEIEMCLINSDAHYVMFAGIFEVTGDSYEKVLGRIVDEFVKALKVK